MDYFLHILILILLYTILSQSLNLTAGYSGLISLVHAGFFGIGAYVSSLLAVNYDISLILTLPAAMIITGIIAILTSTIALRTVDDYFIVITLGLQIVIFSIFNNLITVTNGPLGIAGIPGIKLFGIIIQSKIGFLLLCLIFSISIYLILRHIVRSPYGKLLIGTSEDEIFMQSLGKKVNQVKITSFTLGAIVASIPGVLYAHYLTYINPSSFTLNESIFILSIVIIGGLRSFEGSFIAAIILIVFPEALLMIGISDSLTANIHQIFYGVLLITSVFVYGFYLPKKKTT